MYAEDCVNYIELYDSIWNNGISKDTGKRWVEVNRDIDKQVITYESGDYECNLPGWYLEFHTNEEFQGHYNVNYYRMNHKGSI